MKTGEEKMIGLHLVPRVPAAASPATRGKDGPGSASQDGFEAAFHASSTKVRPDYRLVSRRSLQDYDYNDDTPLHRC